MPPEQSGPYYRFWQGWKRADVSKEASEKGKAAAADADSIMTGVMWTAETDFAGDIRPGDHENVRFTPR